MDSTDKKIIACRKVNSRENASVIGAKVNMSVSAVIERIKKLEASGIIKQYTLVLDGEKSGLPVSAYFRVSMENSKFNAKFEEYMEKHPHVTECYYTAADYDYLIKAYAADMKALRALADDIKSLAGVSSVTAEVILTTVKEESSPEITE